MNISEIINGCNYGSRIEIDSPKVFEKKDVLNSIYYEANGTDICDHLRNLYNKSETQLDKENELVYDNIQNIKKTIDGNLTTNDLDNDVSTNTKIKSDELNKDDKDFKKNNSFDEHFGHKNKSFDDNFFDVLFYVLIFTIFMVFVTVVINNTWKYFRTYHVTYCQ